MTPPKTLENLTYRENINIFQWALYITDQTSSQNKIYHVQVDWKVNKTSYSSGDDLRENIAVRAGSAIIRKFWIIVFFFFLNISQKHGTHLQFVGFCSICYSKHPEKKKKKITELCNDLPRCHSNTPNSTNSVTRVQCASLSTIPFAVLATKHQLLINTWKTFKIAERISGHVHEVERAHNPAWELFHHLMNSLPEAKQIKNAAALGVKKGSFHSKWNGSIILKVS